MLVEIVYTHVQIGAFIVGLKRFYGFEMQSV